MEPKRSLLPRYVSITRVSFVKYIVDKVIAFILRILAMPHRVQFAEFCCFFHGMALPARQVTHGLASHGSVSLNDHSRVWIARATHVGLEYIAGEAKAAFGAPLMWPIGQNDIIRV